MDAHITVTDSDRNSGLGQYRQRVSIEVEVVVHVGTDGPNFNEVESADLREAIVDWVERTQLGNWYAEAEVSAGRGPSDGRYFWPGEQVETARRPWWVSLDTLLVEKVAR
jgi:hypothetical protein